MPPACRLWALPRGTGKPRRTPGPSDASVAVELLHALAPLLRLERERRRRARKQARNADRLAGLLAEAVRALVDHLERLLDLLQELPLAVARAQLQRVFLLERRAIRRIGRDLVLAQMLAGVVGVGEELIAQLEQALAKERELRVVHVILVRCLEERFFRQKLRLLGGCAGDCVLGDHCDLV